MIRFDRLRLMGVNVKSSKTIILTSLGAVALGVTVFLGIQFVDSARRSEAMALNDKANSLACETYMKYSYVNFKDKMSLEDYKENHRAIQALAALGGDSEYVSLLNSIASEYELLFAGQEGEPILEMAKLNDWCEPFLNLSESN